MALVSSRNVLCRRLLAYSLHGRNRARGVLCDMMSARQLGSSEGLSNTTLIMQSGMDIQELPLVVKKVTNNDASVLLFSGGSDRDSGETRKSGCDSSSNTNLPEEESLEIAKGFANCNTTNEILKLLEIVPSSYVNSSVAFHILKRMAEIDTASISHTNSSNEDVSNNFTKTAVFNHLINIILSSNEPTVLLDCLALMNRNILFKKSLTPYFEKLKDQVLMLVTENKYNITNVCSIINEFHAAGNAEDIDKLWVGVTEGFVGINEKNVMNVFRTLPYFKKSRFVIASTLHRKMVSVWWNISGNDVAEILNISKTTQTSSHRLLQILARWLNTKIHSVSEDQLMAIVGDFQVLDFVNSQMITALERYVKIKGMAIQNPQLFATIMDYCSYFRIRSTNILNKCCDYFIQNGRTMPSGVLRSLIVPFGNLDYNPNRSYEYWKTLEEVLTQQFPHLHPDHVLDILISCVYLERFPINFINDVFNPFFLKRLQTESDCWNAAKSKLKLFDQSLTLECNSYNGPLLYKDLRATSYAFNDKVRFFVSQIEEQLISIAGSEEHLKCFAYPRNDNFSYRCYLIDVLILNTSCSLSETPQSHGIALLLHTPQQYIYGEDYLIGSEVLRTRHLRKLGYKVVNLNYFQLLKLRNNPNLLIRHIKGCIRDCL